MALWYSDPSYSQSQGNAVKLRGWRESGERVGIYNTLLCEFAIQFGVRRGPSGIIMSWG